jgi:hypothetical protein
VTPPLAAAGTSKPSQPPYNLLGAALGVLAGDEHLDRIAEREVGREGVVDDGAHEHRTLQRVEGARSLLASAKHGPA